MVITEEDAVPKGYTDEEIFFSGMSEKDICINMAGSDLELANEFKITDYEVIDEY